VKVVVLVRSVSWLVTRPRQTSDVDARAPALCVMYEGAP